MQQTNRQIFRNISRNIIDFALFTNSSTLNELSKESSIINMVSDLRCDIEEERFIHFLDANRLTTFAGMPILRMAESNPITSTLRTRLEKRLNEIEILRRYRDSLLRKTTSTFDNSGIKYSIFKTLNAVKYVGVDVDVMIREDSYWSAINALRHDGFHSIDNLSKEYATGFVVKDNPIVLDLHTEMAVLGIRYISPEHVLSRTREIRIQGCDLDEPIDLFSLEPFAEAVLRMAHAVIKEGQITLGELCEVLLLVNRCKKSLMNDIVREMELELTVDIFLHVISSYADATRFGASLTSKSDLLGKLALASIHRSAGNQRTPIEVPFFASIIALYDLLRKKHELTRWARRFITAFRYERNMRRLGQKLVSRAMNLYDGNQ